MKLFTALLIALAVTVAATPAASAGNPTPVSHLVDCDDSFWVVACQDIEPAPVERVCEYFEVAIYDDCAAFYTVPAGPVTPPDRVVISVCTVVQDGSTLCKLDS